MTSDSSSEGRRTFLKAGSLAVAASSLPGLGAQVAGSDEIRIALVGCGNRGTGAAEQSLNVPGTRLVAMADAFPGNCDRSHDRLRKKFGERVEVPKDQRFGGFEAYKQAIDAADVVLLCSPPGFRPAHFEYAVQKGKHVFMEKPVAVDSPGVRKVIEAAKLADQKNLKVVCGLQRRYQRTFLETREKIREGLIGELVASQINYLSGGVWVRNRKEGMSEMEYQMRNWYYFNWIGGDQIVEQFVHGLDVGNWFKGAHPVKAVGSGGRSQRIGKDFGEIYDHMSIVYQYADGSVMNAHCRHWRNALSRVNEEFRGTKGIAKAGVIKDHKGKTLWRLRGPDNQPYQVEHDVLYRHVRDGKPINNAHYTAEVTMTAILGKMAAYSGQEVSWDQAMKSELSSMPGKLTWDADPGPKPGSDGLYPCPVPGKGQFI